MLHTLQPLGVLTKTWFIKNLVCCMIRRCSDCHHDWGIDSRNAVSGRETFTFEGSRQRLGKLGVAEG